MKLCKGRIELNCSPNLNGHVKRDRNDSIQDDGVGEKNKHSYDGGTLNVLWHDDSLPGQVRLKIITDEAFPDGSGHGTKATNRQQKEHNLEGQTDAHM